MGIPSRAIQVDSVVESGVRVHKVAVPGDSSHHVSLVDHSEVLAVESVVLDRKPASEHSVGPAGELAVPKQRSAHGYHSNMVVAKVYEVESYKHTDSSSQRMPEHKQLVVVVGVELVLENCADSCDEMAVVVVEPPVDLAINTFWRIHRHIVVQHHVDLDVGVRVQERVGAAQRHDDGFLRSGLVGQVVIENVRVGGGYIARYRVVKIPSVHQRDVGKPVLAAQVAHERLLDAANRRHAVGNVN